MKNDAITKLLIEKSSIDISKFDEEFLNKTIQKRINETSSSTDTAYFEYAKDNSGEIDQFINTLFINYSEFFRNPLTFSVLEKIILPHIKQKKNKAHQKEIRIWSVACASGQETYSLAMLLKELKISGGEEINFRIFATDYCDDQIAIAEKGHYTAEALNNVSIKRLNHWFDKQGNYYVIKPELKENIEFSNIDLLSKEFFAPPNSIFGDFDIVICANLLFYYKPQFQKTILEKIEHSIASDGYLITGETEREILMKFKFDELYPQSCIFKSSNFKIET